MTRFSRHVVIYGGAGLAAAVASWIMVAYHQAAPLHARLGDLAYMAEASAERRVASGAATNPFALSVANFTGGSNSLAAAHTNLAPDAIVTRWHRLGFTAGSTNIGFADRILEDHKRLLANRIWYVPIFGPNWAATNSVPTYYGSITNVPSTPWQRYPGFSAEALPQFSRFRTSSVPEYAAALYPVMRYTAAPAVFGYGAVTASKYVTDVPVGAASSWTAMLAIWAASNAVIQADATTNATIGAIAFGEVADVVCAADGNRYTTYGPVFGGASATFEYFQRLLVAPCGWPRYYAGDSPDCIVSAVTVTVWQNLSGSWTFNTNVARFAASRLPSDFACSMALTNAARTYYAVACEPSLPADPWYPLWATPPLFEPASDMLDASIFDSAWATLPNGLRGPGYGVVDVNLHGAWVEWNFATYADGHISAVASNSLWIGKP